MAEPPSQEVAIVIIPIPHPSRTYVFDKTIPVRDSTNPSHKGPLGMDQTVSDPSPPVPATGLPFGLSDPSSFYSPGISPELRPQTELKNQKQLLFCFFLLGWLHVFSAHDHNFGNCTVETLS